VNESRVKEGSAPLVRQKVKMVAKSGLSGLRLAAGRWLALQTSQPLTGHKEPEKALMTSSSPQPRAPNHLSPTPFYATVLFA
jgi:hypothetical protein